jgi:hypothetical protein
LEDFSAYKTIAMQAVKTKFRQSWQFKFEIPGAPADFDFYVKDVSYGPIEVQTDPEKIGASTLTITWPTGSGPVELSMTMRDNEDGRIHKWFKGLVAKVLNDDGTVGLPADYCIDVERFTVLQGALKDANGETVMDSAGQPITEIQTDTWTMYPTQLGDVTESRDEPGFCEFPITFVQFKSL